MATIPKYSVIAKGSVLVAEVDETCATHIIPEITISNSGNMILTLGSGSFFLSHDGAMCLADMLAEAAMLGEGVDPSTFRDGAFQ